MYRAADCYVSPTRGEGWGMPITEVKKVLQCVQSAIQTGSGLQYIYVRLSEKNNHENTPLLISSNVGHVYGDPRHCDRLVGDSGFRRQQCWVLDQLYLEQGGLSSQHLTYLCTETHTVCILTSRCFRTGPRR